MLLMVRDKSNSLSTYKQIGSSIVSSGCLLIPAIPGPSRLYRRLD